MSATASEVPMLNVQVDGEWKQFPKGTRLIEACMKSGHFIPHYCYHPKLSSPGNCRMCLVELGMPKMTPERKPVLGADGRPEIAWSPRPAISCATEISEGMAVRTESPLAEECRKGVMEFLLINHPLDCPICDQAGECRLQEFSVEYGNGESRFVEEKVKKPKRVDIGPRIVLDDERCIMCSRCIRFMQEIAHDDVLGFVNRGSHTTLTVYPGKRLDNNYSLNTVDICPVGRADFEGFPFQHAGLVSPGDQEHRRQLRQWHQHPHRQPREHHLPHHSARKRFRQFVLDARQPPAELPLRQQRPALKEPLIKGEDLPASWPRAIQAPPSSSR